MGDRDNEDGASSRGASESNKQTLDKFVDAVKTGQRCSWHFKTAWHSYCTGYNQLTFDPTRQNLSFLKGFFENLGKCYLAVHCQTGSDGQPIPVVPSDPSSSGALNLVPSNLNANSSYSTAYSNGNHNVIPDISHSAPSLGTSDTFNANGTRQIVDDAQTRATVNAMIKAGQKADESWKLAWIEWCDAYGNSLNDPYKHNSSLNDPYKHNSCFVVAFVFNFGLTNIVGQPWANDFLVSFGELAKPYMSECIRKGQSESMKWRDRWAEFIKGRHNSARDPRRQEPGSLMEFFDTIAIREYRSESWMQAFINGSEMQAFINGSDYGVYM